MTSFALTGALLALLSLLWLTRPLWRAPRHTAAAAEESLGLRAMRQQLEQLAGLKASGVLSEAQYDEARQALERRIVEAVTTSAPVVAASAPPRPKALVLGLSVFVCAVAAGGYGLIGTPQALDPAAARAAAAPDAGHSVTAEQIEAMIAKLAARMKEKPDDADGWAMLGRSYAVLGRFEEAAPALKQAVTLRNEDPVLLTDYADALAVVNGRNLDGEPSRLIDKALKIDPNNLKALSLAGTAAFNRKDYPQALVHWQKMVTLAPNDEIVQQIQGGIDEARRLAGGAALPPPPAAPAIAAMPPAPMAAQAGTATGASVSGTVTLAPALAAKAKPDDTVFIFARAAEGPRMPLAILRKQVKDLPFSFTLDDSMAMTPSSKLSMSPKVVVGARVSARGNATPAAGDLQGFSSPVAPGASGLKIQISEVVAAP